MTATGVRLLSQGGDLERGADLAADVCVIGAGPVGITIGRELMDSGLSAIVLESGDVDYTKSVKHPLRILRNHLLGAQEMSRGRNVGQPYTPLSLSRARAFGGSSRVLLSHGLQARPLDTIDFERREGFEYSGWPVKKKELDGYYAKANQVCGLGPYDYDPSSLETIVGVSRLPLDDRSVETTVYRFAPRERFASYLSEFEQAPAVRLITDATVVALTADRSRRSVESATVRSRLGNELRVRAGLFVLATGAIENARILLHLLAEPHGGDLVEAGDVVGRFFMEHPQVLAGIWRPMRDVSVYMDLYNRTPRGGHAVMAQLRLTDETIRGHQILNGTFEARPRSPRAMAPAVRAVQMVRKSLQHKFAIPGLWNEIRRAAAGLPSIAAHLLDRRGTHGNEAVALTLMAEQEPNPESAVRLGQRRDRMGLTRPILDWRLTRRDLESMRSSVRLLSEELERQGLGRIESTIDEDPLSLYGNWHQMGTTRMDITAERGVVDPNCRVFGTTNLYAAGCSVFPTGGCSNPTLTAVALGLRLADHLVSPSGAGSH